MNSPLHFNPAAPRGAGDASIGVLLQEAGKLTPENTDSVLRMQEETGIRFGEAAQALGMVSAADVQQALARQFDYPFVPAGDKQFSPHLVAAYDPFSRQVEMLRAVRAQLMLRWFGRGHKALAIVGVEPGCGASLFAANLAVVFSQLGQNTLLVDANLRHPAQRSIFGLAGKSGLSDMLAGRATMAALARIDAFESLAVLGAGTPPPNPAELLARKAFTGLNAQLEALHDIVLYDTSDVLTAHDALPVMARARGVLLVVHKNASSLYDVAALGEQVRHAGAEVLGSVLLEF
ncbi:chain length determinant protein tyrosine kinase EpsG [Pseudoduganella sp. DS3]|uniref:Chain length determinant protein tyrosine kinase EpsG n=1 Tax=Pseudoduganella guangdongensis TaxID=2692179 RepID=A0A6N9HQJ1_9BURK|nr:chain length determinant protein tyrosine kinase EpsG [Pseudoduganella guangdongensis]MYN04965.1 chain length determinant protein tyrosine kinase EpsG [Pseudoduganella guangdongensis]